MPSHLIYTVEDAPPIHTSILLGLQQFLTMMGGCIAMPLIVAEATCVGPDLVGRAQIMGTMMFVNGICTLLQIFFGVRLPIVQGASFAFVAPMMALQNLEGYRCPTEEDYATWRIYPGSGHHRSLWMSRFVQIQGAILLAGVLEAVIGSLGLVSAIFRYIGPLTIAPTTALIALSLVESAISQYAAKYWPISLLSMSLVVICALYLARVSVPIPVLSLESLRQKKIKIILTGHKIFSLFPVLIAILISWGVCAILTLADALPQRGGSNWNITGTGYSARSDIRVTEFTAAPWFRVPYPGQWGLPQINLAVTLGMFAAVIASIVESIGDYCACARMCAAPLPPHHAVNRGIFVEGIGCVIAGAFGCGPGVTSYSENIGAIGITGVASRRVIFVTACFLIVFGCFTKMAAFFVLIPEPIIGGILIVILSMVAGVGFSNLQFVDLNSTRNLLIFGLALFLGLGIPAWVKENQDVFNTGSPVFDEVLVVLLSTGMFVGGLVGFILDNTVPKDSDAKDTGSGISTPTAPPEDELYDLPLIGGWIKKFKIFRYIPISPTFDHDLLMSAICSFCQCFKNVRRVEREDKKVVSNPTTTTTTDSSHQSSNVPSVATVNEAFDRSSVVSRTASMASLTLSFSASAYPTPRSVPLAPKHDEQWTDL